MGDGTCRESCVAHNARHKTSAVSTHNNSIFWCFCFLPSFHRCLLLSLIYVFNGNFCSFSSLGIFLRQLVLYFLYFFFEFLLQCIVKVTFFDGKFAKVMHHTSDNRIIVSIIAVIIVFVVAKLWFDLPFKLCKTNAKIAGRTEYGTNSGTCPNRKSHHRIKCNEIDRKVSVFSPRLLFSFVLWKRISLTKHR